MIRCTAKNVLKCFWQSYFKKNKNRGNVKLTPFFYALKRSFIVFCMRKNTHRKGSRKCGYAYPVLYFKKLI